MLSQNSRKLLLLIKFLNSSDPNLSSNFDYVFVLRLKLASGKQPTFNVSELSDFKRCEKIQNIIAKYENVKIDTVNDNTNKIKDKQLKQLITKIVIEPECLDTSNLKLNFTDNSKSNTDFIERFNNYNHKLLNLKFSKQMLTLINEAQQHSIPDAEISTVIVNFKNFMTLFDNKKITYNFCRCQSKKEKEEDSKTRLSLMDKFLQKFIERDLRECKTTTIEFNSPKFTPSVINSIINTLTKTTEQYAFIENQTFWVENVFPSNLNLMIMFYSSAINVIVENNKNNNNNNKNNKVVKPMPKQKMNFTMKSSNPLLFKQLEIIHNTKFDVSSDVVFDFVINSIFDSSLNSSFSLQLFLAQCPNVKEELENNKKKRKKKKKNDEKETKPQQEDAITNLIQFVKSHKPNEEHILVVHNYFGNEVKIVNSFQNSTVL